MDDLDRYMKKRMKENPEFWKNTIEEFELFKVGIMLKQAREESGMTQDQIAKTLKTNKSAISRIENHASDIRLSTLEKFAHATGKRLRVAIE